MDLNTIWFGLIAVLFIGFFLLEGFDFGVGMLLPFIGRGGDPGAIDTKRRVMINSIGPHWDGNEVWLLTAGGAIFAAFPMWYATMFSGFYIPLFIILLALIGRAVAFEFRSKDKNPKWRSLWDWLIFIGSLIPALLFGVAFGNLARGVPIDASMNYIGGFLYLLNPYALLGGIATVLVCALHGSIFLNLKTTGEVYKGSQQFSRRAWIIVVVVLLVFLIATYFFTDIISKLGSQPRTGTYCRNDHNSTVWVFHSQTMVWMGFPDDLSNHSIFFIDLFHDHVSSRYDFQPRSHLQFDNL